MNPRVAKTRKRATPAKALDRAGLLEQALKVVCVGGFDGYLKRVSPSIAQSFGYDDAEMAALPLAELVHPDERQRMADFYERLCSGHPVTGVETRVRAKDGSYKWILWDAVPCVEQQLFLATGHDITERKMVEDRLRESQERFELIASATNDSVWDWDLRNDSLWRNQAYYRTFGDPADASGVIEWWRQRIHPEDLARVLATIPAPMVDGEQKWTMEYRLRRHDGTYANVLDRGFVIFDRDGKPVRMVGSVMDVTKLIKAEQELRESDERFRLAAKATQDAIWDWDIRRNKVWRSEAFETLFGYCPHAVSSDLEWWVERTHPDDRDRVCSQIYSLGSLHSRQSTIEYRFRRADGTYADVLERGYLIYDEAGKPVRMVGSMMDLSERRRAEEMAAMQRAELARMARVSTMGEIATGFAHELNQPLAAIANYAESCAQALSSQAPDARQKLLDWIEKIAANTHRAGEIIRRLRGFTRNSEHSLTIVDANDLVREVIELVEPETRRQQGRVLWQPAAPAPVAVDPVQIQQVIVNLVSNAVEAMAALPPERRQVTLEVAPGADTVRVSEADLGPGVPEEHRDRVFEAFFTTKPKGVGIGLAISRSIVEEHGGRLWVEANPQGGATFHFTLPVSGDSP
jgi:PAS domain S-box-containing protein